MTFNQYPQTILTRIESEDEFGFLKDLNSNWESHRPLLYLSLALTDANPTYNVTELGSGEGSTPYLRRYCEVNKRKFKSFDSSKEWSIITGSYFVGNWDSDGDWREPCSLLFVDHAPGEHRKVVIDIMQDKADIIVVHDTELGGAGNYGFEPLWSKFRYVLHLNRTGGGAGATAVSQKIDLNRFKFLSLGKHKFE